MERENLLNIINLGQTWSGKAIDDIKRDFLSKDIKHQQGLEHNQIPTLDLNESKIHIKVIVGKSVRIVQDVFGFEEEEVDLEFDVIEIDFYEEFERALENVLESCCNKFIRDLDKKGVYTAEGLEGYKSSKLKKVNDLIAQLEIHSDMEEQIKIYLVKCYNKLYNYISNFKLDDYQVSSKLKFKLNKNQLIWLFFILHREGIIAGLSQNDLFRFLEANFMYYDDDYKSMAGVRIQANKLTKGDASPEKSIEVLSEIFKKDFFQPL